MKKILILIQKETQDPKWKMNMTRMFGEYYLMTHVREATPVFLCSIK